MTDQSNRALWLFLSILLMISIIYSNYVADKSLVFVWTASNSGITTKNNKKPKIDHAQMPKEAIKRPDDIEFFSEATYERNMAFKTKYERKCSKWRDILLEWKHHLLKTKTNRTLVAYQEHSGLGDRMMGIQGALVNAIDLQKQLQVDWFGIDEVFEVTDFIKNPLFDYKTFENESYISHHGYLDLSETVSSYVFRLIGHNYWQEFREPQCEDQIYWRCDKTLHKIKKCDTYNRACSSENICEKLVDTYVPPPVEFIGCPLRSLLKFKPSFLESEAILTYYYKGIEQQSSFHALTKRLMAENQPKIAVHLRFGDSVIKSKFQNSKNIFEMTDSEKNLIENAYNCFENSIFIFASDNERIRQYIRDTPKYSTRSVILSTKPIHISDLLSAKEEEKRERLIETFIEWFLIYLSDELITNEGHIFGISAFSRSARLFALENNYHLVNSEKQSSCKKQKFLYDGNIKKVRTICKKYS